MEGILAHSVGTLLETVLWLYCNMTYPKDEELPNTDHQRFYSCNSNSAISSFSTTSVWPDSVISHVIPHVICDAMQKQATRASSNRLKKAAPYL